MKTKNTAPTPLSKSNPFGHLSTFTPPRLVDSNPKNWYIVFYADDPISKKPVRFRHTYDLNRIDDLDTRRASAQLKIAEITRLLPQGYPFFNTPGRPHLKAITVLEAMGQAWDLKKAQLTRADSINSYSSQVKRFIRWLHTTKMGHLPLDHFTRVQAFTYLDTIQKSQDLSGRTLNNYMTILAAVFSVLTDRGLMAINPFKGIPKARTVQKNRRALTPSEARIIHQACQVELPWLFVAVVLIQFCFLRPRELTRLKGGDFNIPGGFIRIGGHQSKNRRSAIVTIPDVIRWALDSQEISKIDPQWFVFGSGWQPHPTKKMGKNEMNRKHRAILEGLVRDNKLTDIQGISLYSWKDTGALNLIEKGVDIISIRDQMRHSSLDTTQRYIKRLFQVNDRIRGLDYDFGDL